MNPIEAFKVECEQRVVAQGENPVLKQKAADFFAESIRSRYSYNFTWMGRPIIQYPQDMIAMQELIWAVKPDLLIETGIAHGGSLIFYASLFEMMGHGEVIGIDIDIRAHNRKEIENHPMFKRITLFEGSSVDEKLVGEVRSLAKGKRTMVVLDSNHTHEHVLRELQLYHDMVSVGSYLAVFDTVVNDLPDELSFDRPWNSKRNPKTAVHEFLKERSDFVIDRDVENRVLLTVAPDGYLKKVR